MSHSVIFDFTIENIYFKTGYNAIGHLIFNTTANNGFYFMDTCQKSLWKNYYNYYDNNTNDILTSIEINTIDNFYFNFEKFTDKYLIYFDHKLADSVSTIPLFYSGLVPNIHNKNILSNPTFQTSDINKLLFIPLLWNKLF